MKLTGKTAESFAQEGILVLGLRHGIERLSLSDTDNQLAHSNCALPTLTIMYLNVTKDQKMNNFKRKMA